MIRFTRAGAHEPGTLSHFEPGGKILLTTSADGLTALKKRKDLSTGSTMIRLAVGYLIRTMRPRGFMVYSGPMITSLCR